MIDVFLTVLNMSLTASFVILTIILLRLLLKRAPKVISYLLWSIALFRLLCPLALNLPVSVIPSGLNNGDFVSSWTDDYIGETKIIHDNTKEYQLAVASGRTSIDADNGGSYVITSGDGISEPKTVGNSVIPLLCVIWLIGITGMLIYSVTSIHIIRKRLKNALYLEKNIYETYNIRTPFVLGILGPHIFIPAGLTPDEKGYIVQHEKTHIRRHDHIIKPLAFFVLSIHWFNPLVWLAFILMGSDMELSCDERVIKEIGGNIKKAYCLSLLSLATEKHILNGSPLAFGEGNVKGRIQNVLNYKKPAFWVVVIAVIVAVAVGVGLMTNPGSDTASLPQETGHSASFNNNQISFIAGAASYKSTFKAITAKLTNNEMEGGVMCGKGFSLVKQVGDDWKAVPFAEGRGFTTIAISLAVGESETYTLTPDMLTDVLEAGTYRIVTYISTVNETESKTPYAIWAEFTIESSSVHNG